MQQTTQLQFCFTTKQSQWHTSCMSRLCFNIFRAFMIRTMAACRYIFLSSSTALWVISTSCQCTNQTLSTIRSRPNRKITGAYWTNRLTTLEFLPVGSLSVKLQLSWIWFFYWSRPCSAQMCFFLWQDPVEMTKSVQDLHHWHFHLAKYISAQWQHFSWSIWLCSSIVSKLQYS